MENGSYFVPKLQNYPKAPKLRLIEALWLSMKQLVSPKSKLDCNRWTPVNFSDLKISTRV